MPNHRGTTIGTGFALVIAAAMTVVGVPLAAHAEPVILEQHATLTTHAAGMPTSAEPGRNILNAQIDIDIVGGTRYVDYVVELAGDPLREDADSSLTVGFGHVGNGVCEGEKAVFDELDHFDGSSTDGVGYFDPEVETLDPRPWDCAFVALEGATDQSVTYDAMVAELTNVVGEPELTLKAPKKVKAVKGYWTDVEVEVGNTGQIKAENVRITGSGKGVKIKPVTLSSAVAQGDDPSTFEVQVKLTKPVKKANLTLKVSDGSSSATSKLVVTRQRPPARPVSGTYSNSSVNFTIKKGKVVGFSATTQTTCGGYPSFPTYTQNTYNFPTARIAGNGIVDAFDKGNQGGDAAFSVSLEMYVVGGKVKSGVFSYYGPARCRAVEGFKNLRVKR